MINQVIYDSNSQRLYIAGSDNLKTRAFLFQSPDFGDSWQEIQLDITDPIYNLELGDNGFIYLATPSDGIYLVNPTLLDLPTTDDVSGVSDFQLQQNYPNPFNSKTTFKFYIPSTKFIELNIYNVLGNKIKSILQGENIRGWHHVSWDAKDDFGREVASGIYIYQLTMDTQIMCRKMLLLR